MIAVDGRRRWFTAPIAGDRCSGAGARHGSGPAPDRALLARESPLRRAIAVAGLNVEAAACALLMVLRRTARLGPGGRDLPEATAQGRLRLLSKPSGGSGAGSCAPVGDRVERDGWTLRVQRLGREGQR